MVCTDTLCNTKFIIKTYRQPLLYIYTQKSGSLYFLQREYV